MKRLLALALFITIFTQTGNAQDYQLDRIIEQYCANLNIEEIKQLPFGEMQSRLFQIGRVTREKYPKDVSEILLNMKLKNPELSEDQLNVLYTKTLIFRTLDISPEYRELALMPLGKCPEENESLKVIHEVVQEAFESNKGRPYAELNKLVVSALTKKLNEIKPLVKKDYAKGVADPRLMIEMNCYLFHNCTEYLKMVMSERIDKAVKEM
ncbi:hypothetical protein EYV94_23005 [Puteibacter caeruleilacunae]|nr:hypothetical protein EYV94_23005 [Puteibacter caeruleilacunae]